VRYENRIVAFIDILGFKRKIEDTIDKDGNDVEDQISSLSNVFDEIQHNWSDVNSEKDSKRITIFSDSIVVSVLDNEKSQVFWTLLEIKHLIMSLLYHGILVRGAVAHGKLIHEGNKVFGPALVEAYDLESKAAQYPRVILDKELVDLADKTRASHHSAADEKNYVTSLLEKDSDGMYYIDYFFKASKELSSEYDFPEYISNLGDLIRKGMMGSVHKKNADLRIKFYWMRERYNQMVDAVKHRQGVATISAFEDPDIYEFYQGLNRIGS